MCSRSTAARAWSGWDAGWGQAGVVVCFLACRCAFQGGACRAGVHGAMLVYRWTRVNGGLPVPPVLLRASVTVAGAAQTVLLTCTHLRLRVWGHPCAPMCSFSGSTRDMKSAQEIRRSVS